MTMLSYKEALARLLDGLTTLTAEAVSLREAAGRTLAEPVVAAFDQPPFPASAMDGYAIRWSDMPGPWTLIGESAAGRAFDRSVGKGETVRIFTGAPLPDGADTVVVQEDVTVSGATIALTGDGPPGEGGHVRQAGSDFRKSNELLNAGQRVGHAMVGLAATSGHNALNVVRRPRVTLIATGDELVLPGETPGPSQIVAGNGVMLASLLEGEAAMVEDLGIVPDDLDAISRAIAEASSADIVVTIGGASVGDHDLVRDALDAAGATLDFWRIAIKPGKPLIAGRIGAARLVGLPGNPVSAFVCATLFLLPMIRRLQGLPAELPITNAELMAPLPANSERGDHLRAQLSGGKVTPIAKQGSAHLAALATANALIVRPPHAEAAEPGESVPVLLLDRS
ncbi:MAG: gephyrin-like molybdotransferase Glp [Pacificimonas sp.]